VILKHTSLAPILLTLTLEDVYNIEYPSRSLILISEDSPGVLYPVALTLSVNFVVELPESSRHNAIMTVVDSISKRVHFIPMHTTVTAEEVARLFLYHVWKLHSLPKRVVSDCRPQFVASFTKELSGY